MRKAFDHLNFVMSQGQACNVCILIEYLGHNDCQLTCVFDLFRVYGVQWLSLDIIEGLIIAGDGFHEDGMADRRRFRPPD